MGRRPVSRYRVIYTPDGDGKRRVDEVVDCYSLAVDEAGFTFHARLGGVKLYIAKSAVDRVERIEGGEQ